MAYVTPNEYLDQYGEQETTRLTDETRSGAVDTAKLEEALEDATAEVEAYVGKRYTVPLADPPSLVRSWVKAIAREDLHRTRATPAVKEDAQRARDQLLLISSGKMVLPTPAGIAEEDARPSASSAASEDATRPIMTDEALAGFTIGTGPQMACWRR